MTDAEYKRLESGTKLVATSNHGYCSVVKRGHLFEKMSNSDILCLTRTSVCRDRRCPIVGPSQQVIPSSTEVYKEQEKKRIEVRIPGLGGK